METNGFVEKQVFILHSAETKECRCLTGTATVTESSTSPTPGPSNRQQWEFTASIYILCVCFSVCLCMCVWSVYLGSKSPAAGSVAVCQDLLIGVWGRDYEGWETYIHTKQDEGKNPERRSPFTNRRRVLLLSLLLFCSLMPFSKCFYPKCLTVLFVHTFIAFMTPLGKQRQPTLTTTLAEAVPCSANRAMQDHTLLSSSLVLLRSRSCKLLE